MTTITKEAEMANAINAYIVEMAPEWQENIKREMQLEKILDTVYCVETYAETKADFTNVIQAYQGKFTPTGQISIGAMKNELQAMKTDLEFDEEQLEQFRNTQFPLYHPAGQGMLQDNGFIQKLLNDMYFAAWTDEMAMVAVKGERVAPTSGTAGTVLGSITGFDKVFDDGIAAGDINTITTGVIEEDTIVDQVQASLDEIPKLIRKQGGTIFMSEDQAIWYSRKYKKLHPYANIVVDSPNGRVLLIDDYQNFVIQTLNEKDDDTRFWIDIKHKRKTNMIVGKHRVYSDMPSLTAFPIVRGLKLKADWHRFYGLRRYEFTYVTKVS